MAKDYVLVPSENFAKRAAQVKDYHPYLCRKMGRTHRAYGWSKILDFDWDNDQVAAYVAGYREGYDGL